MDILKMDNLKTGKALTIAVCIFALLTEVVIIMATGDRGGLFITLVMLFLIYIGLNGQGGYLYSEQGLECILE